MDPIGALSDPRSWRLETHQALRVQDEEPGMALGLRGFRFLRVFSLGLLGFMGLGV